VGDILCMRTCDTGSLLRALGATVAYAGQVPVVCGAMGKWVLCGAYGVRVSAYAVLWGIRVQ